MCHIHRRCVLWQPSFDGNQHGMALLVVMVIVLLSALLTLWGARSALLHEMIVGNDVDHQRAFTAAQALLQDAELDIQGKNASGHSCHPQPTNGHLCRDQIAEKIPQNIHDLTALLNSLHTQPNTLARCRHGLCVQRTGAQDFWNSPIALAAMSQNHIGARYGQFTGAQSSNDGQPMTDAILMERGALNRGGWYWIEVLPYDSEAGHTALIVDAPVQLLPINASPSVVYRITALAYGRKPNTVVVLQQTYIRQKSSS